MEALGTPPLKEHNLTVAYPHDGTVTVGYDLTVRQLEEIRDHVIPILIERTKQNGDNKGDNKAFRVFIWPPDTSRMDRI